jgi:hypothetical protein
LLRVTSIDWQSLRPTWPFVPHLHARSMNGIARRRPCGRM